MRILFVLIISLFLVQCQTFDQMKSENYLDGSNAAVFVIDKPDQNISYFIYQYDSKLYLDAYEYIGRNKSKNIMKKYIDINYTNDQLKFSCVGNDIFIFNNNTLYIFDLPIEYNDITASVETIIDNIFPKNTIPSVKSVLFNDTTCVYFNTDGDIFIYENDKNNFTQYAAVKLDNSLEAHLFIETEKLALIVKSDAELWFNSLVQKMTTNQDRDFSLNKNEEKTLQHWNSFKKYYNSGNTETTGIRYNNFNEWYNNVIKAEREKLNERKTLLLRKFETKWGVMPDYNINLFAEEPSSCVGRNINTSKRINYYRGNNSDIQILIEIYNGILSTYANLEIMSVLTSEFNRIFELNFRNVSAKIIELANHENTIFEIARRDYFDIDLIKLDEEFNLTINNNFNSLEFNPFSTGIISDDFGYIFLPSIGNNPEYTIVYKKIEKNEILEKFIEIGQNISLISLYNDSLYVCEDGKIAYYDIFTLEKEDVRNTTWFDENRNMGISESNERVLFSLDAGRNIVVTERNSQFPNTKRYYLRCIRKTGNIYRIVPVEMSIKSNTFFNIESIKDVFFVTTVNIPDEYLYVNIKKSKSRERLNIYRNYIYRETPTGAGIIFGRSK